jgi:uncharacterized membrane-anchored protein YhcB (DUF1043 family)
MPPPLLTQLFEEAIQRSTELTTRAQAAATEAGEVLEGANAIGGLAVDEAEALHRAMAEALEAIGQAREEIDIEAGRTSAVLDGLPARADTTEAAVRALLAGVQADAAHLAELRARLLARVDESTQHAETELRDLERQVHDYQERLESRLAEAADHVTRLRQAVDEGRTHLGEEEHRLREAIQSLGVMATDQAHAFAASLHAVLLVLGRRIVEFCNHVVESHNGAVLAWRSRMTDETPAAPAPSETWVQQALQPIRDALAELALLPQPAAEALRDSAASIVQDADKALSALASITHSLEHALPTNLPTAGGA